MKFNEHPAPTQPSDIWCFRCRRQNIWFDGDEMASRLAATLSDVDFYEYNGWWYCDWSDIVAILLDLFKLPHHKDSSWPPGAVKPILEFIPDPLMFQRGWAALRYCRTYLTKTGLTQR